MNMVVWHFLQGIRARIGNQTIAVGSPIRPLFWAEVQIGANPRDGAVKIDNLSLARAYHKVIIADIRPLWNHQNMGWALRIYIVKRQGMRGFIDFVAGNFMAEDFCEDIGVVIGICNLAWGFWVPYCFFQSCTIFLSLSMFLMMNCE